MDYLGYCSAAAVLAIMAAGCLFWRIGRRYGGGLAAARHRFLAERSALQQAFFEAASLSGKPRGLRWTNCQWDDQLEWMRDRRTGQIIALVGVTISFEAIEGGDMEGIAAVGNLRNATAVFFYQDGRWQTSGRTVFNLNPAEAVAHFRCEYEHLQLTIDN